MKRLLTVLLAVLTLAGCVSTVDDRTEVTVGVGGQPLLVYLPTTLADRLGHYREEGLQVKLEDMQSGSKALQALQGGSVHVVSGYYDHTIQMQAKNRAATAFAGMLRLPSLALVVSPKSSRLITSITDLRGATVGVTSPGSSTDFFLKYLLVRHGLAADAAGVAAIGGDAGAVAAVEQGKVDAAVMVEPSISLLRQRAGNPRILADTHTVDGLKAEFGVDNYAASVLYSTSEWLAANTGTARKLASAIVRTLKWIDQHSAAEIADRMPPEYTVGNREVYIAAIERMKESFSKDGVIHSDGAQTAYTVLSKFNTGVAEAKIDLGKTYTNDYLPR
ncbi:ABC transporter substrate-binding protein [Crossiella sp. SN42]|uniref:ABC transporter substrate-binding protein n=1 Tax=Crossiella sp. SN42 TaxID=2944808 RepID=UPI00207CCD5F|nr:ABC transporter substrate-binding protein [Crossiella sp. SN42]MCO1576880.1 ABC transporter substrate-binding protein [Crossiella sp. SN42]